MKRKDRYGKVLVGSCESWVRIIDENFDNSMGTYNYLFFDFIDKNGLDKEFDEFLTKFLKETNEE